MSDLNNEKNDKNDNEPSDICNIDDQIDEKHIWKIMRNYFNTTENLVNLQLESFNYFINSGIQNAVDEEANIKVVLSNGQKYGLSFGEIFVSTPSIIEDRELKKISPLEARQRDLDYSASICCDLTETIEKDGETEVEVYRRVPIGRVPIMLRSCRCNLNGKTADERIMAGECENDDGGYFIIKGIERVLVSQIRANYNNVIVMKQKKSKYKYIAEIRSMSDETGHSVLIKAMIELDNKSIYISLPYIKEPIPVGILFKALGFDKQQIIDFVYDGSKQFSDYIRFIIRDSFFIKDQDQALKYIGQFSMHIIPKEKRMEYAQQVVETELFPHLGITSSRLQKAIFVGNMLKKLLHTNMGVRSEDDRDNFKNKRVETSGILCYELFRTLFKRYIGTIRIQIEKKKSRVDNILSIINRLNVITSGLKHCFSTGNWGVKNNSYVRTGVSQVMSRLTYGATLSHKRRMNIPVGKEGKNSQIRQIHTSGIFFVCPAETPEGQAAGIVLNLALSTKVTTKIPTVLVKESIYKSDHFIKINDDFDTCSIDDLTPIFLNGILCGMTEEPDDYVEDLKKLRLCGIIHQHVSIVFDMFENEVKLYSDSGRMIRPIFTVNEDGLYIKKSDGVDWKTLVKNNLVQYIDNSEIEEAVVAMFPKDITVNPFQYNYCEIHPTLMLGVMGNIIPFPDHSQSPRNCYECSMGKQALGMPALSYQTRTDTILYVLDYPQRPIVNTMFADMMGFNKMPAGQNAIVAICCYSGYNQEDSIIMNQSSIDRGLYVTTSYRTVSDVENKTNMYTVETIGVPPRNSNHTIKIGEPGYYRRKNGNYSLLDENGIVRKGITVKKGDIIIGKWLTKTTKSGDETKTDCSIAVKSGEDGVVDRIVTSTTPNGYKMVKVIMRKRRVPEIGDKFASRSAQKGTVGMTYRQEDMPWNAYGISPDIIINPHAIPSRMTVNQLMETVLGKACCIKGDYGDATPFTSDSVNNAGIICDLLKMACMKEDKGYDKTGWETLYSGFTGEPLKSKIFMGPTYYQRLKHMVSDKIHSRSHGNVTTLTRQPLEGRSRDGGLRFGEHKLPKWYGNILLVCGVADNTSKLRGLLVIYVCFIIKRVYKTFGTKPLQKCKVVLVNS